MQYWCLKKLIYRSKIPNCKIKKNKQKGVWFGSETCIVQWIVFTLTEICSNKAIRSNSFSMKVSDLGQHKDGQWEVGVSIFYANEHWRDVMQTNGSEDTEAHTAYPVCQMMINKRKVFYLISFEIGVLYVCYFFNVKILSPLTKV